jgi:outer membrane protein assembly factor BamB
VKDQVVFVWPLRIVAYAPEDGKLLWSCEGLRFNKGDVAYSSPMLAGDLLVYNAGYNGPALGVQLGGSGDVKPAWRIAKSSSSIGSGVIVGDHAYLPFAGPNTIECMEVKTGKTLWKERQKGPFWGSIVLAGGRGYVTDQKGRTVVFKPNPEKFEGIAVNELGEDSNSTPAISDGQIFIRTFKGLYCIAE